MRRTIRIYNDVYDIFVDLRMTVTFVNNIIDTDIVFLMLVFIAFYTLLIRILIPSFIANTRIIIPMLVFTA